MRDAISHSPLTLFEPRWRLQEAEALSSFQGQDERDLSPYGDLISFGTEITVPSDKKSGASSPSLGRRAGGRVLVVSALRFSSSAQLIAPQAAPDSAQPHCSTQQAPSRGTSMKVKSTTRMLQRRMAS